MCAPGMAGGGVQVQLEARARLQLHPPSLEPPNAELRPLHIGEDPNRAPHLGFHSADGGDAGGVILMAAMGKIKPEDIGPGAVELFDHLRAAAGGAQRCDDFGTAPAAQNGAGHHAGCLLYTSYARDAMSGVDVECAWT